MRNLYALLALTILLVSCATAASKTIADNLRYLGLDKKRATCMGDELEDRLSNDDLVDLVKFTSGLSRASSPEEAFRSLRKTDNPRALLAITRAGAVCAFVRG